MAWFRNHFDSNFIGARFPFRSNFGSSFVHEDTRGGTAGRAVWRKKSKTGGAAAKAEPKRKGGKKAKVEAGSYSRVVYNSRNGKQHGGLPPRPGDPPPVAGVGRAGRLDLRGGRGPVGLGGIMSAKVPANADPHKYG